METDKTIFKNKPYCIIRENEKGIYLLIDFATAAERILISRQAKNFFKIKYLRVE
jgi:hypothetical protein